MNVAVLRTDGLPGLLAAIGLVWIALAAALGWRGAPWPRWVLSPLLAAIGAVLALGVVALIGPASHGMPPPPLLRGVLLVAAGLALGLGPRDAVGRGRVLRGARIEAAGAVGRRPAGGGVTLAGVPLSPADETKHTKLIGTTGTGKSTLIAELLAAALARGDRAIVADPDGGYVARFYRPERGDRLLTPFDPRAASWALFDELAEPFDVDELARALVPDTGGAAREWAAYARTFVAAVIAQLRTTESPSLAELYRLLLVAEHRELALLLEGTPAQPFLETGNERMFSSLRSVAANAVRGLAYLHASDGPPLAVRQWVRTGEGVLFLPYRADQVAALRAVISAWLRLAILQTLSLPPTTGADQRPLWFIVDELDALGAIDGLGDALARLRKFGGRCVLGFQSIAQVSSTYGAGIAHTLVENCGNSVILRCSASEGGGTARFASQLVGEREVTAWQISHSTAGRAFRRQTSTSRTLQRRTESALLPAEIEQLPDRAGYLKLASAPAWVRVAF